MYGWFCAWRTRLSVHHAHPDSYVYLTFFFKCLVTSLTHQLVHNVFFVCMSPVFLMSIKVMCLYVNENLICFYNNKEVFTQDIDPPAAE